MRTKLYAGVAFAALVTPAAAFAQSTGSIDFEGEEAIVVTGARGEADTTGVQIPQTPKARAVITQELIERRQPGQSILDTINLVPGVSFTNSDAYGSSGGNLRIRGFDGARVSLTFDGIPLNDSGNYAIYSNQQLDPELIEQVNVNFGTTDVDSPTASASGGTVNYRSITPRDEIGGVFGYTHGTFDFNRAFALLHTGTLTSFGTKAWLSGSVTRYDQFRGFGEIKKKQVNGKIYQPLGDNGDFVSVSGHYNENRNSFYSNPNLSNLRTQLGSTVIPATPYSATSPYTLDLTNAQFDAVYDSTNPSWLYDNTCSLNSGVAPVGNGTQQTDASACSNVRFTAINPSNTGNVRLSGRYTLSDALTFSFDGAYQYVKANGGGSTLLAESNANSGVSGVYNRQLTRLGAGTTTGVDINRDGDQLDLVRVYFPSNTRTQRLTATASLRYELDANNTVRLAYAWDRARHRQTGEATRLSANGMPADLFNTDGTSSETVRDAAGRPFQKRDRLSYAVLHQVAAEYRGTFFDALKVTLGVRAPFFRRNLNNYCYTIPGSSNDAYCTSETAAQVAANPTATAYGAPYKNRVKTYSAVLPNVGFTYDIAPAIAAFGSYAKGFSAPRTDNLYSFDDKKINPTREVVPEKTDSFDLGLRYNSRMLQAQLAAWYISYNNRIISSLVELEGGGTINIDRNVGKTETKGIDFSVGVKPIRELQLYGFVSYIDSELKQDAVNPLTGAILAATKGKFVVETPEWTYGGRAQLDFSPVSVGVSAKHTGDRYVTDVNDMITAGYTVVDLDARLNMGFIGLEKTYLQFNANNLLKERYFGNLSTTTDAAGGPRFTFGAPRTFSGSLHVEF